MSQLLNVINYAIEQFTDTKGFKKTYFHKFLNYSDSQCPKYLNPTDTTKQLKIVDLEDILNGLDLEHKKMILDSLCQTHGFVCSYSADFENNQVSLSNLLHELSFQNGSLAHEFLEAMEDGTITSEEKEKLQVVSYSLRKLLRTFEERVKRG